MMPQDPFFIVLDITGTKNDIIDCKLIVYILVDEDPTKKMPLRKPVAFYLCQFSEQSDTADAENGTPGAGGARYRPYRIWEPPRGRESTKYYDPKILKRLLKEARFAIIPNDVDEELVALIQNMNHELQLCSIYRFDFCYSCKTRFSRYTLLDESERIPLERDRNRYACEGCAWSILLDRLERKGVKVTPGLKEILISKFKKLHNIDRIEKNFDPALNPVDDENFSLYDTVDLVKEPFTSIKVEDVGVNDKLKAVLVENGIETLLPVQVKAIKAGLLEGKNLLVASSTSSGKTLIGELAGVNRLIEQRTAFLFVVPLVALANQKYLDFKKKYEPLGYKAALRVGGSRIDKSVKPNTSGGALRQARIVVGTYEGVDYLLRAGRKETLPTFGTIVIDEIQMFRDEERGSRLDGFIARLKFLFPKAQFIYLSATVANPTKLAKNIGAKLVDFFERPVPIERHLVPCLNESEKIKAIVTLVKREFKKTSSYGFKGQSIIFTNSRRSVHELASILRLDHIEAEAYHSGLTYGERLRVERRFEKQAILAVVTTAALGAGVDLPASQVIFHSLTMGIEWLDVAEFNQMLGRAGRFHMHDRGKIFLLVEPGKKYHASQTAEEDKVALKLLTGTMEDTMPAFDMDQIASELLAFTAMQEHTTLDEINRYHGTLLTQSISAIKLLNYLHQSGLISVKDRGTSIRIMPVGKAICESFLGIEEGLELRQKVEDYEESVLDMAASINPLKNVYVTNAILAELAKVKTGHSLMSSRFFGGQVLDFMTAETGQFHGTDMKRKKLSQFALQVLMRWSMDIFTCECSEKPNCEHGPQALARIIMMLRRHKALEPAAISKYLHETYQIQVYTGDINEFLDSVLQGLDAIERFAHIVGNEKMTGNIAKFRVSIESPEPREPKE
jgi:helicase